jgi:hypothetical protein
MTKGTKSNPRPAAIRIMSGKRIDLNDLRRRRDANAAARAIAPSIEDTRVADAWQREEARAEHQRQTEPERKRITKLLQQDGGKSGTKIARVKIAVSAERKDRQNFRSRPGTFEWRYGRNKQDALFHAGSFLAQLWERAGITVASPADFLRGTRSGYATGIAEGRVVAIDKLKGFRNTLGTVPSSQLVDYCVVGLTATELAHKYGIGPRDMAAVLHHHLIICAKHFGIM